MRFPLPVTPHCTDLLVHVILLKSILLNKESIHYLTAETMAVIFSLVCFSLTSKQKWCIGTNLHGRIREHGTASTEKGAQGWSEERREISKIVLINFILDMIPGQNVLFFFHFIIE